ncbi:MAG: hypothetical protein ACKPKO_24065, partial [Candidatus Fonsibacter sp.]
LRTRWCFFSDELEVAWLAECTQQMFDELAMSSRSVQAPNPNDNIDRWRKLDFALARGIHNILRQSKEALTEDVVLEAREMSQNSTILKGRRIVWMMLDYFKTNKTLQEQYKY